MKKFKVSIIGSGIVGMFIALKLSSVGFLVEVFEKNDSYFLEQSYNNSRILHPNYEYDQSKLKTILLRKGKEKYIELNNSIEGLLTKKDAYIIGNKKNKDKLIKYYEQSINNGENPKLIDNYEIKKNIPNLSQEYDIAIRFDTAYILNLEKISNYLFEKNKANDVRFHFNSEVIEINKKETSLFVKNQEKFEFDYIINTSGIKSNELLKDDSKFNNNLKPIFNKGTYILINNYVSDLKNKIIYPIPNLNSKGVLHISIENGLLVGPSTNLYEEYINVPKKVMEKDINILIKDSKSIIDNLDYSYKDSFYGIRTINKYGDFFINSDDENNRIIHLIGISSPGLTAAPAIADYIYSKFLNIN